MSDNEGINARDAEDRMNHKLHRQIFQPMTMPDYGFDVLSEAFQGVPEDAFEVPPPSNPSGLIRASKGAMETIEEFMREQKLEEAHKACNPPRMAVPAGSHITGALLHTDRPGGVVNVDKPVAIFTDEPLYIAEYGPQGEARLMVSQAQRKLIANFHNFADAQTAAEALNNHKGY